MTDRRFRQSLSRVRNLLPRADVYVTRHSSVGGRLAPFAPNSSGPRRALTDLSLESPRRLFQALEMYRELSGRRATDVIDLEDYVAGLGVAPGSIERCRELLDAQGSDKAGRHNYHLLYAVIADQSPAVQSILEVGLGSNFDDTVSNMGARGVPGASLRAFREIFPNALVYGADVDRRILFSEERIQTFWVDQTDQRSIHALIDQLPELDVVIDDGLHSPDANIAVAAVGVARLRVGGWLIVEDIAEESLVIWRSLVDLIASDFDCVLVRGRAAYLLVGRRRALRSNQSALAE